MIIPKTHIQVTASIWACKYICVHTCVHTHIHQQHQHHQQLFEKEVMNLKDQGGYMGGFKRIKREEK